MLSSVLFGLIELASASPLARRQASAYPAAGVTGPAPKAAWVATLEAAHSAGRIPNVSQAYMGDDNPAYPDGVDVGADGVCSWTLTGCLAPTDIFQAPNGSWGVSFDDGPLDPSPTLYTFLAEQNQTATHFLIGSNILSNPDIFQQAVDTGGHLAIHTWSHPYMTTLNDTAVLGELGWTAQIIFDLTGLIPRYWRPPYGDADNRIRAIAKEVFGLETVLWNDDSDDWCLSSQTTTTCGGEGPGSLDALESELRSWQQGPMSPGIIGLEHELTQWTVSAFISTYPGLEVEGWNASAIPDLFDEEAWYLNAWRNDTPIEAAVSIGTGPHDISPPAPSTSAVPSSTSTSPGTAAAEGGAAPTAAPSNGAPFVRAAGVGALAFALLAIFLT
ncbi:hypothetical protein JCM10213_004983 [Rhodosporidiobolus nylandii]